MIMVNARMSERSARRWRKMPRLITPLLGAFSAVLAQSDADGARLQALGAQHVTLGGNIKYDAPPLAVDGAALEFLKATIGNRPHWLAASTHPGDEHAAAEAHATLAGKIPNLLTLIAPRHPVRTAEIVQMLRGRGLNVAIRSRDETITAETDIYIADTLGEMGLLYRVAGTVFVAGSLASHGGHNPVEPALLNSALLAGPDMRNFEDACTTLANANALTRINSAEALADALEPLLQKPALRQTQADAAEISARALGGASASALGEIMRLLAQAEKPTHAHA
jgi:3-deoxy-D-manno-octulosonic-acid transferase